MRMEDVNARKAYIQNVRKSFDSTDRKYEFERESNITRDTEGGFSFFKVRLCIAVIIFGVYIFCDKTNTAVYHVSMKDISETIAKDFDYSSVKEELQQVFHVIEAGQEENAKN